ncbi:condensation domain-containing protein [Paenibacillus motobuensis]|uniref:Condensation domain-containing protein n=1 Tax=Paenibacillus motobuensis TaxID=295324 RepID=A0ABN0YAD6_9BACL
MKNKKDMIKALSREQLAALLTKTRENKKNEIVRADRSSSSFSQSYAQQRQWFMEQLMSGGAANVPQSYLLKGEVRPELLEAALNAIVERHESLRTVFNTIDYVPSQIIKPYEPFKVEVICLEEGDREERMVKVREINREFANRPFDLTVGPLWRFCMMRLSAEETVLTLSLHHMVCDGWSFGVIMRELAQTYAALLNGEAALPPLPVQYADYSEWQRRKIESGELDNQLAYWSGKLRNAPPSIRLPFDYKRSGAQTYRGRTEYFTLDGDTAKAVHEVGLRLKGSAYHLMLSVLSLLLHHCSLDETICIGTPVANRNRMELESLIGLFINTVVIQSRFEAGMTFAELFAQVRDDCREAFNHAEIPFEKVVAELGVERQARQSPVFQVLYVQTEESMLNIRMPGIEAEAIPVSTDTAQFDLSLYATMMKNGITAGFEYNTDLFSRNTITGWIEDFKILLRLAVNDPQQPIERLLAAVSRKKFPLTVVSSFESGPIAESIEFWLDRLSIRAKLQFAPYSQVFQQLIDEDGLLGRSREGIGLIMLRLEDWMQGTGAGEEGVEVALTENTRSFIQYVKSFAGRPSSRLLLLLCPSSDKVDGNRALKHLIGRLEERIAAALAGSRNVELLRGEDIIRKYGLEHYNDGLGDEESHVPYLREFFAAMGTETVLHLFHRGTGAPVRPSVTNG